MVKKRNVKLPKQRRKYHPVYALDGGLDYSKGSTFIKDTFTPSCREMIFRYSKAAKARGTNYFGSTNTTPLLDQVMHFYRYKKTTGSEKTIAHTITNVYAYNATSSLFENITRGLLVQDCEDNTDWTANANVTLDDSTDSRKGTNSLEVTIAVGFVTGVAVYDNFGPTDYSGYTHLRFFIKSDTATLATDLDIRLSEEDNGAITGGAAVYEDVSIPALAAGVWKEVGVKLSTTTTKRNALQSISLIVAANQPAIVVNIDDIVATIETTGDEDNTFTSTMMNNYYVYSNNITPIMYWDMSTATTTILYAGCVLAAKAMGKFGERLCLYHTTETGVAKPQRVRWTIVGGLSTVPAATDWTNAGSGNTDLEGTMGSDFIQNAEKLGNYMVIYGERTIVLQEYVGIVTDPYAFYTRVTGKGLAAPLAIANLGNEHIFLGWDNVYAYKGGKEVLPIGNAIEKELFSIVNPEYIKRSFMVYIEADEEVRLYIPTGGNTLPDTYFSFNIVKRSWSRGVRSYTSFGFHTVATAVTWDSIGSGATDTWDNQDARWDDVTSQALAPITIYGDSSGIVHNDDSSEYDLNGVAIDGWVETKDFVTGDGYRRTLTNWMELQFEVRGHNVDVSYSVDFGASWSTPITFSITSVTAWEMLNYDFEANSTQVRFKFRNATLSETFEVREMEIGYVEASDRGV